MMYSKDLEQHLDKAIKILNVKVKHSAEIAHNSKRALYTARNIYKNYWFIVENGIRFAIDEQKDIYYENLNYYKKFGGVYPSYEYISHCKNILNNFQILRRKIYKYVNEYVNKEVSKSFEEYIYLILNILKY